MSQNGCIFVHMLLLRHFTNLKINIRSYLAADKYITKTNSVVYVGLKHKIYNHIERDVDLDNHVVHCGSLQNISRQPHISIAMVE